MANRYYKGGNWSNINSWSATVDGAGGASVPTSSDNVYWNSVPDSATYTVDANAFCLDMDWTGATNIPTFAGANTINVYGSCTFIAAMVQTTSEYINMRGTSAGLTFTAGGTLACGVDFLGVGGEWTLQDNLNIGGKTFYFEAGTLITGNKTITCGPVQIINAGTKTLTAGSSIINCTSWLYTGSSLTLTANTATINVSGTGVFAGGNIATYNNINLNGTAHTVSGNFTCNTLTTPPATTQTITQTAGNVIKCTTATLSGDATHQHIWKSGTAGTLASLIATNHTDDYVTYTDMRLSWKTLTVKTLGVYNRVLSAGQTQQIYNSTK